jgi:hypothetical protein
MGGAAQAAGDVAFVIDAQRKNTAVTPQLLGRPHLAALIPFRRRGGSSFALRVRLRRLIRGLRHGALLALHGSGGVGDDVEIVGNGLHGGSSFC